LDSLRFREAAIPATALVSAFSLALLFVIFVREMSVEVISGVVMCALCSVQRVQDNLVIIVINGQHHGRRSGTVYWVSLVFACDYKL